MKFWIAVPNCGLQPTVGWRTRKSANILLAEATILVGSICCVDDRNIARLTPTGWTNSLSTAHRDIRVKNLSSFQTKLTVSRVSLVHLVVMVSESCSSWCRLQCSVLYFTRSGRPRQTACTALCIGCNTSSRGSAG